MLEDEQKKRMEEEQQEMNGENFDQLSPTEGCQSGLFFFFFFWFPLPQTSLSYWH